MSDSGDWLWDDASIRDDDELLRKVPQKLYEDAAVLDLESGERAVGPAMLRYDYAEDVGADQEGMSVHLWKVLEDRGRDPRTLHALPTRALVFRAKHVRAAPVEAGVIRKPDSDEEDEDLSSAHGLVRHSEPLPKPPAKKKQPIWNRIRSAIAEEARWVQATTAPESMSP
ncbi:hypothetical protein [Naasia sp. SYSU D00057]|uniref:hypothetical protein n=1 Tax=Naasia sp. SYSU D00057 TaxID=2817380 RepID=UPI001B304D42|nr:hypothetical protein [Naasia sp. SYSU D00057]